MLRKILAHLGDVPHNKCYWCANCLQFDHTKWWFESGGSASGQKHRHHRLTAPLEASRAGSVHNMGG